MMRRPSEPESSVAISRNAKGVPQFEVTVRGTSAQDCMTFAKAYFQELCDCYPFPETNGGGA
jgi:hypothetical protein